MKKLNNEEWEVLHWALSVKQIEEIQEKGFLNLTREQAIETLKESLELGKTTRENVLATIVQCTDEQKEMINKIIEGSQQREKEEKELLEKLENDKDEYLIGFMKGTRGE